MTGTCSLIMPVIAVSLPPILAAVSSICSVDNWSYMKKKGFDGTIANVTISATCPRQNVVFFVSSIPPHASPLQNSRCKRCCGIGYVIRQESRICAQCGESNYHETQTPMMTSNRSNRNYNRNAAKRVSHFRNWVARLQGKERCNITKENLEAISQIVKMYPTNITEADRVRMALKSLHLQKYYNNIYFIMRQIMGYAMVEFKKINEARLLALFMRIQEPFSRIQSDRTNMMSYQFLIRKFCELLGYSVAYYIPLLKSRMNLQRQDAIWREICEEMELPFYPSV